MKIAIFGWYGHDNAGDERIKFCLNQFLMNVGGIDSVDFYDLHEEAINGATNRFDSYNLVIIGGGGIILSHHNYHDFILGIKTKIVTVGVSVETALKGNPRKFSQALIEKSTVVLVRDQGSYDALKNLDSDHKIKVSSDLTFLKPYELTITTKEKKIGINLLAKMNSNHKMLRVRTILSRFSRNFHPKPICFKEITNELRHYYQLYPIPLYCEKKDPDGPAYQFNDILFMEQYFEHVPKTFNPEDLDKCSILLSMRLHGLIFAAQKGIPFLTFSIYPKQINFLREVGLEINIVNIKDLHSLKHKIKSIEHNMGSTKEKIIAYRSKAIQSIQNDMTMILNHTLK